MSESLILGVDPGTTIMGFSLLKTAVRKSELITLDVVKMTQLSNQSAKLKKIFETTLEIIEQYQPTILAIEAPFFGKNPQSMLKLGRAQGIVIAASLHKGLEVFEYSPRKIKQSITGNGSASKEQVAAMLKNMYPIPETIRYLDATDALAVAVCHHLQNKIDFGGAKFTGWESFINQHKDRIIK
ncbi:MAG: crossover junction endodeoxyribonuclease RuvC [Bacteroidales bacterium]